MTSVYSARASLIALSGALMLLGSVASAQTSAPAQRPATGPATSAPAAPAAKPAPNPLAMEDVSKISGAVVYGNDDKRIGSVSTALMKPEEKKIDRLVVSDGGILGIGKHQVALPLENFTWDATKAVFRVSMTSEDLKNMPAWKEPGSEAASATGSSEPLSKTAPAAGSGGTTGGSSPPPAPPKSTTTTQ